MQTVDMSKCIEGIFVKELKNRFLCEVLISGKGVPPQAASLRPQLPAVRAVSGGQK